MFEEGQLFEIRMEPTGPTSLTMSLYGEFDLACRELFEAKLDGLGGDGLRELVIDLTGVTFLDSSAIRMLLGAKRSADQRGHIMFAVPPADGQVRKVLELTGVIGILSRDGEPSAP